MVINGHRNKPIGPGGSTRRLTQRRLLRNRLRPESRLTSIGARVSSAEELNGRFKKIGFEGGETGSTRV
jgi:hypothetical protein